MTAIETKAGCATVKVVEDEIEPEFAVMVALPNPALVAIPLVQELLLTTTTVAEDELQITNDVTSFVLPSA